MSATLGDDESSTIWDVTGVMRVVLFWLFIALEHIILFNLVLARLSAAHDKIENTARGELAKRKAVALKEVSGG